MPPEIHGYYNQGKEQNRLLNSNGKLERARTQELLMRYLPQAPATIADIGGGAGIYALWLTQQGYHVHLRDLMPIHIEQAINEASQQTITLASASVADARTTDFETDSMDAVLLMGPLYHLQDHAERLQALREARRILKPAGVLMVATISCYASLLDGLARGYIADPHFVDLVESALTDGRHGHDTLEPRYFTHAFFHHPDKIQAEITGAGFAFMQTLPIEGPIAFASEFDKLWDDEALQERLLAILRRVESDPIILGASSHNLSIAYKAEG